MGLLKPGDAQASHQRRQGVERIEKSFTCHHNKKPIAPITPLDRGFEESAPTPTKI